MNTAWRPVRPQSLVPVTPHAVPVYLTAFPLTRQKSIPADDDGAQSSRAASVACNDIFRNRSGRTRNDGS